MKEIIKNIFHNPNYHGHENSSRTGSEHSLSPCETPTSSRARSPLCVESTPPPVHVSVEDPTAQLAEQKTPAGVQSYKHGQNDGASDTPSASADIALGLSGAKGVTENLSSDSDVSFFSPEQEKLDLRLATSEIPTVVMELDLDCNLRYMSKSWEQLVGTSTKKLLHKPISNILIGSTDADLNIFHDAVSRMIADNASYKVKFVTATNDVEISSDTASRGSDQQTASEDTSSTTSSKVSNNGGVIELEAQGILIFSPTTHLPTHSIWTIRPFIPIEMDLTIPSALVDLLGFGAEIFEGYLISLQEAAISDENFVPEPKSVICRVCETSFPAWFIEKHNDLCVLEHKVADDLQFCNESLEDHRNLILRISEYLWNHQHDSPCGTSTPISTSSSVSSSSTLIRDYKGISLPSVAGSEHGSALRTSPSSSSPKQQASMMPFRGSLKFPFGILQSLVDYCDEALSMNPAEKSDTNNQFAYSPNTESAVKSVMNWPHIESSDSAIRAMIDDTNALVKDKLDYMTELASILQYSELIKREIDELVLKAVKETVSMIRQKTHEREHSSGSQRSSLYAMGRSRADSAAKSQIQDSGSATSQLQYSSLAHISPPEHPEPQFPSSPSIHSPRPERLRSPASTILDNGGSKVQLQSFTPKDLLSDTSALHSRGTSLSPNTLSKNLPVKALTDSMEALVITNRSSENASVSSSIPSPRHRLSPAPYVEKQGYSSLQRNSNTFARSESSPRATPSDRSDPGSIKRMSSPSSLILPAAMNPINSMNTATSISNSPSTYSAGQRNSFSSGKPPLSPLLVSQPSNHKPSTGGIKDYEILKAISKGAYGSVFLAKQRLTGDYVAIKCLKKRDMIAKNQVLNVRAERAVMIKQTDSPYVAQLYSSFQTKDYLYLVMEYMNGGDCATLLKMLGTLGDKWAKRYIAEVIVGVDDLHKRNIIHRDLKPDNLLIDSKGHLKLTDFGLSRVGVVGRHTVRHRKSSSSEQGIEIFRKSILGNPLAQSPLANTTAIDSPELLPNQSKRHSSVTPFLLSPVSDSQSKFNAAAHGHSGSVSSHESSAAINSALNAPGVSSTATKKKSISHFRSPSTRSNSASSGLESPNLKPMSAGSPSETFDYVDDEFSMSPGQNVEAINSYTLFDPNQDASELKRFVGTPDYLAPETITGEGQGEYSDWWSIGCILFEFLYGYPPFHANTPEKVFNNILKGVIDWPQLSEEEDKEICPPLAKDLIKKLLTLDFEQRLGYNGADEIKQHPYFKDIKWDTLYSEEPESFIPTLEGPESTDYFDLRGADISQFPKEDTEMAISSEGDGGDVSTPGSGISPGAFLSLPGTPSAGKKERRGSKLVDSGEFGSFNFRNINVLEKANKDVINRLKSEHREHRSSFSSSSSDSFTPGHKSRGSSISSNIVNLGSPFKRPVSPAPSIPSSPAKDKLPLRLNKKWDGSGSSSSAGESRTRSMAPSLSRQLLSRGNTDMSYSSSSDTEESSLALDRLRKRRQSLRHTNSSESGSSQSTQSFQGENMSTPSFRNDLDVLYCEPIPIVRHTVTKLLEKNGCIVLAICDGDELIRRASSKVRFDVIFTALRLPKVEAIDAVKLIKCTSGVNTFTPIIAVTAFAKEASESGVFDDVLEKPVDSTAIQSVLSRVKNSTVAVESDPEE